MTTNRSLQQDVQQVNVFQIFRRPSILYELVRCWFAVDKSTTNRNRREICPKRRDVVTGRQTAHDDW